VGLWNFCDDYGRHPFSPKQVKAEVFPADPFSEKEILAMLEELLAQRLIERYVNDGVQLFHVTGWKHQRVDKPQSPKYPGPFDEHSTNDLGTLPPDRKGEDRKGKKEEDTPNGVPSSSQYVFESGVIRLTEKNFKDWETAFANLNLRAELLSLTEWAEKQPKWFYAVSAALAKRDRAVKAEIERAKLPNNKLKPGQIEGILY